MVNELGHNPDTDGGCGVIPMKVIERVTFGMCAFCLIFIACAALAMKWLANGNVADAPEARYWGE